MIDLTSVRLFDGIERREVNAILVSAGSRKFKVAETIILANTRTTQLIVVKKGFADYFVHAEKGQNILIRRFVPGDVFGMVALLQEPVGYLGTAVAVTDVEVLAWDKRDALRIAHSHPRFSQNAFRLALHYIALYAHRHTSLVCDSAQERLAYALTNMASRTGTMLAGGVAVNIKNEDLASLADVSVFTASRTMKKWEGTGAVEKSRGKVLIRCPEKLLAEELPPSNPEPVRMSARSPGIS